MNSYGLSAFKAALRVMRVLGRRRQFKLGLLLRVGLQDAEQPSTQQKRCVVLCNKIWGRMRAQQGLDGADLTCCVLAQDWHGLVHSVQQPLLYW